MGRRALVVALGLAALLLGPARGARASGDLMDLSLEELAAYKITSVSRSVQSLNRSAAAIYVITREDMRRSGYTSVAEALRMVPGLQVARTSSHDWAIGARGFNTGLSNKMLVMIDGRSVYSPLFSGVFWELRDVPVEDIERIEVIRGPGGATWGANAVNGVIHVITRPAAEARGWTAKVGGGSEEQGFGLLRHGGSLSEDAEFRLTASGARRDDSFNDGAPEDAWWLSRLQGRTDWRPSEDDRVTLLGEIFGGELEQSRPTASLSDPLAPTVGEDGDRLGTNALARWEHHLAEGSELMLQAWYEFTDLEFTVLRELRHTLDVEGQHQIRLGERHEVVWGGSYRFSQDDVRSRGTSTLRPDRRGIHLVNAFLQDRITLWPERADLTLGSRFEYNEFTDFEFQPSGRLTFTPNEKNTLWAAASRAVRTPTRLESDADLGLGVVPAGSPPPFGDPALPTLVVLRGNDDFDSETLLAFEAGYRVLPRPDVSLDAAIFYNRYRNLLTAEFGSPMVVPAMGSTPEHRVLPFVLDNELHGESYGGELAGWWQARPWWRLHASYAYLQIELEAEGGSSDSASEGQEGQSPHHQVFLRSSFDLPRDFEFDAMLRYVDRLPNTGVAHYVELDLRLGWRFCEDWELAVVGQNLIEKHHREGGGATASRVQRGVYGQLLWRWGGPR